MKYLFSIVLILISTSIFSQQNNLLKTRTAPTFTLMLNLNYNQAMGQFAGTYNDVFRSEQFIGGRNLGADKGFGGLIVAKKSISKYFRASFGLQYNRLVSFLFSNKNPTDLGEGKYNMFSASIGLENNFTPIHRIKLYAGADALFSMINGKATVWVENRATSNPYTYQLKINNSFRIGAAINAGAEYLLNNNVGLNLGFRYNFVNLLLRNSDPGTDSTQINLVDDDDPNNTGAIPIPYVGKKQIAYISVTAGVTLYWGINDKKYIIKKVN